MNQRRILVTAALPYANGPIHMGHLVEYIQTDIWVRFQKLRGHNCTFVCADDTHGTAIMISAKKAGISEEEWIEKIRQQHIESFNGFDIQFDNYGSTNSPENKELCHQFWTKLKEADIVIEKDVTQLYDCEAETYLADRFVHGTCPYCKSENQYGDNCDKCGHTYSPTDLIDPVSTLSGSTPEIRTAAHLFVQLEKFHDFLNEWTQDGNHLQKEVANYLKGHFLGEPLRDWDISRPGPYFGFEIPDSPNNFWYVWFDAPIGYIASTKQWCDKNNENFDEIWKNPETEIHHFIGKDITYFHTLFWPAMLKTAEFNLPTKVHIHGFLTVGGEKMSKTKGTFINADMYRKHLNPAWLRYYYASKLGSRLDDIDLNLDEFVNKINSDLIGKVINLASRTAKFMKGESLTAEYPDDGGLFEHAAKQGEQIAASYENCDYNSAMREIMLLADRANKYVEDNAPWTLKKDPDRKNELHQICTVSLNLFRQLVIYLSPVLPELAEQTGELLGQPVEHWDESQKPLLNITVNKFKHMMKRIDSQKVEDMIEESKVPDETEAPQFNDSSEPLEKEPLEAENCNFDEFMKIDLRVARVVEAKEVEESNKLLQLTLSLGGDNNFNVFAGIKGVYNPEDLLGKLVVCCANLEPRKMRFGVSEGMVLAAGAGGKEIYILNPDEGAKPGHRVH